MSDDKDFVTVQDGERYNRLVQALRPVLMSAPFVSAWPNIEDATNRIIDAIWSDGRAVHAAATQGQEILWDALERIAWHELTWKEARDVARATQANHARVYGGKRH